jgi:hypothetical protein
MAIVKATVKVVGVRPLMWHWFSPDAISLEKVERTGVPGNDPLEWRKTVLATKEGQLYIPGNYVFGCFAGRDGAAKYTKERRGSALSACQATLQVREERILVDRFMPGMSNGSLDLATLPVPSTDPGEPVYLDIRSVVNPPTKGRNVRYRIAASPGWHLEFTIHWDSSLLNREKMLAIAHDAGALVGLGSGRKIGMGRFAVEEFTVLDGGDSI